MDACREACRRSGRCLFELVMGTVHAGYYSREIENDCSLFARDSHVLSSFYSCWVDHGNYLSPEEKMRKIPAKLVTICIGR